MRILVVAACPFPWPRGTPVRIQRLSEALWEQGAKLDVVTYGLGDKDSELPFPVWRCPNPSYYQKTHPGPSLTKLLLLNPMLVREVMTHLQDRPVDVIHAHHIEGLLVALLACYLKRRRIPIVYDAHTAVGEELKVYGPGRLTKLKSALGHWLDRALPSRAQHIVAVTEGLRDRFVSQKVKKGDQISVVPNGVEADFVAQAQATVNSSIPHKRKRPRVVFAGNLAAYQGIEYAFAAFAQVLIRHPNAELHLLTDGDIVPYQAHCKALGIWENIQVRKVSFEELPGELATATVLLNPRTECSGIPQKLLNYMAAGQPVVSFEGSAKVVEDGHEARVVENGNVDAFASAICDLIENREEAKRLADAARTRVLREHTWSAAATNLQDIYARVINQHRAAGQA